MSVSSISAGPHDKPDAKLFEEECWETLSRMHGMTLLDQGSCIRYNHGGQQRACPDIVGLKENGHQVKGFVVDCKLYGGQRRIDGADVEKLRRDMAAVRQKLRHQGLIRPGDNVTGIFVSTASNIVRDHQPLKLITINYAGGLGEGWEQDLQRKIRQVL